MFVGFYLQKSVIFHSAIVQGSIFGLPILYAASLPKTGIDVGYFPFLVSAMTCYVYLLESLVSGGFKSDFSQ